MTEAEARTTLGVSKSACISRVQEAYQEKQKQLQAMMIPGNPCEDRQNAVTELVRANEAWRILQRPSVGKTRKRKPAKKKTAKKKPPNMAPHPKPQTLADAWDQVVQILPFSEPVIAALLVLMLIFLIAGLSAAL